LREQLVKSKGAVPPIGERNLRDVGSGGAS
jgi:hypothetical protein